MYENDSNKYKVQATQSITTNINATGKMHAFINMVTLRSKYSNLKYLYGCLIHIFTIAQSTTKRVKTAKLTQLDHSSHP